MSHTSKNRHTKENQIIEFCLLIKELFPSEITTVQTNEKYAFLLDQLEDKQRSIVQILIHHLAQLYQNHRIVRANKIVEIADEDVLTALKIIENAKIVTPKTNDYLSKTSRNYYLKLRDFYKENFFTAKEMQTELNVLKSQTNNLLKLFVEKDLVERYGYQNKGFYYKIKVLKSLEFIEKEPLKNDTIFDDFNDFSDTETIEYQYRKDNFRF